MPPRRQRSAIRIGVPENQAVLASGRAPAVPMTETPGTTALQPSSTPVQLGLKNAELRGKLAVAHKRAVALQTCLRALVDATESGDSQRVAEAAAAATVLLLQP